MQWGGVQDWNLIIKGLPNPILFKSLFYEMEFSKKEFSFRNIQTNSLMEFYWNVDWENRGRMHLGVFIRRAWLSGEWVPHFCAEAQLISAEQPAIRRESAESFMCSHIQTLLQSDTCLWRLLKPQSSFPTFSSTVAIAMAMFVSFSENHKKHLLN